MCRLTLLLKTLLMFAVLVLPTQASASADRQAKPTLKEGAYRVDWNRKVRDLCVDFFTNEDLTAKDWQGVLGAQGVICKLSNVKSNKTRGQWVGACHQPLRGTIVNFTHRVSVEVKKDASFDILTVISGDLQATIPIRGEPIRAVDGSIKKCEKDHAPFRPWQ